MLGGRFKDDNDGLGHTEAEGRWLCLINYEASMPLASQAIEDLTDSGRSSYSWCSAQVFSSL